MGKRIFFAAFAAMATGTCVVAGRAEAAVSYSYVADPSFTIGVPPWSAVTIKLYLLETLTGGSTSLIGADGGVFRVGMAIDRVTGDGVMTGFALNTTDFAGPPTTLVGGSIVHFTEEVAAGAASGVAPGNAGGNAANAKANAVFLGSVNVIMGFSLVTSFRIAPYDANGGDTLTFGHAYDLDATSGNPPYTGARDNSPTGFTVALGPEPSFAGMVVVLAAAGTLVRRRR